LPFLINPARHVSDHVKKDRFNNIRQAALAELDAR